MNRKLILAGFAAAAAVEADAAGWDRIAAREVDEAAPVYVGDARPFRVRDDELRRRDTARDEAPAVRGDPFRGGLTVVIKGEGGQLFK